MEQTGRKLHFSHGLILFFKTTKQIKNCGNVRGNRRRFSLVLWIFLLSSLKLAFVASSCCSWPHERPILPLFFFFPIFLSFCFWSGIIFLLILKTKILFIIYFQSWSFNIRSTKKGWTNFQILLFGYHCPIIVHDCCQLRCTAVNAGQTSKGLISFAIPDSSYKEQNCYDSAPSAYIMPSKEDC